MSLARFGDEARKHPKMVKAGNEAAAFWRWAIEYSHEVESDGFLDESILHTIPPVPIPKKRAKALAELCSEAWVKPGGAGLFERVEGGYRIHDFGEFRPTRTKGPVDPELSEKRREASLKGLANRWGKASQDATQFATTDSKTDSKVATDFAISDDKSRTRAHIRACAPSAPEKDLDPEARRDPDPTSQRATPPPPDATPEAAQAARSEPPPPESSYDLARRVWAELWAAKYHRPYAFSTNLNPKGEHGIIRWLGDLSRERGGADAERWLQHWVAYYLRDHGRNGSLDEQCHPLRWIESAVNSAGEPKRAQAKRAKPPDEEPLPPLRVPRFDASKLFGAIGNGGVK